MTIDGIDLSRVDLNLLVHLEALLAERNVTRAAARVGLSQSAMSHNLARLRALFDDELLTRGPEGLRLTPRAMALTGPVDATLADVRTLLARDDAFDPATAERTFRLGLPDSMEMLIGPPLLAHLRAHAPGIRLRLHNIDSVEVLDDLDADHIELAIGYGDYPHGRAHHKWRLLFSESYVCMFSAAQTGKRAPLSLEDYTSVPHILTSLRHGEGVRGVVDDALEALGLARTVVLTTPRFLGVAALVARAPVLVTMHARVARLFADEYGLDLSPPPVEIDDVAVSLLWHASHGNDAGHAWLRNLVVQLVGELRQR
ncbi:LysR family transcriptional regulator [Acuticoccus sp. I52.16.1]|uniref:LysR family transcriptional regulator n=1 Tax=Acuticoccus sp. I52.16.1 TaxID=2928472 RepID=UPI001FD1C0BF|nr:LysR family transcriptional regulator [Acuticoccus sp. I52.16.1]UOM35911.1 LysR family transcriptional regulator [Acuticoccus sp. I52.16.1]